ncbi:prepilin-type N-terminal cleavage/methylation domain-containing protein [Acinetobacter sp. Marseille-Q1618]|uniref:prepilin-type N-terminal cleavage/methylation domain-containing protein n=1 Tax=Acinetobacter sp. Marseille-Q1618 TaxID=2697502 RepID=UPI001570E730|nr:prepilin-type N-terminal cleavage/methylation domain-containing protein [Acinetobacter sp. Marseille-Q1618]
MKGQLGFTLIELLVVIALIGIISAFAAPNMTQLVYKKQLDTSARELASTLSNVRGTAVSLRKDVSLEFKNQPHTGDHFYWNSQNKFIHLLSKNDTAEGIFFTPTGLAKARTTAVRKEIVNPDYNENLPEDPLTNPKKIIQWENTEDLIFEVCHEKLNEIRSIRIFKSGTIDKIKTKPLLGGCTA